MNHHVKNLLSQIKALLAQLKQSSGDDLREDDVRALNRLAAQLVQINTNSLSRASREEVRSMLVESALFILQPEEIHIIQESERQRAELSKELAGASTRATRREPTRNLRRLDEQQMLFIRGALKNPLKKRTNFKRERKHLFRTMRALGIDAQKST